MNAEQRKQAAIMFGATLSILAHELGHALIGEFAIPSTGPEEDAADEFSALIMSAITADAELQQHSPEVQRFLTDMVIYSSLLWFYDAQVDTKTGQRPEWYDEHSSGETRFRNTLCMIYGSAPSRFKPLADRVGFPDRSRERCIINYQKRFDSWETIIAPFARDLGGDRPGKLAANTPGADVTVAYEPSKSAVGRHFQTAFEQLGLFEALGEQLQRLLVWKRNFKIIFADCGAPNAFYDPSKAQIVMCWEGVEHFIRVIAEQEGL
jgi:hypothetical protein